MFFSRILALGILFAAAISWSSQAQSSTSFYGATCNGCTVVQRENAAIYQGVGVQYVADYNSGILYKYMVTSEPGFGGTFTYMALARTAEADKIAAFNTTRTIWLDNNHSLQYTKTVAGGAPITSQTAWTAVDPGAGRNAVVAYLSNWNNWGLGDQIAYDFQTYVNAFLQFRTTQAITIKVVVVFNDGSRADYTFSYTSNSWVYVDKSSVDSSGNPIPQDSGDVVRTGNTQQYEYPGSGSQTNLNNFLARLGQLGIPVSNATGNGGTMACTKSAAGTSCVRVY